MWGGDCIWGFLLFLRKVGNFLLSIGGLLSFLRVGVFDMVWGIWFGLESFGMGLPVFNSIFGVYESFPVGCCCL